ncbi:hypothetical protein KAW18_12870 [candidate division WOR-3 bacterium]|nr:hypothetical protein [candidate division WOR-3 bacterium]
MEVRKMSKCQAPTLDLKEKMSWKKLKKYLSGQWRYVYSCIFEELRYIFQNIKFLRRIIFQSTSEKQRMCSLFPEFEGGSMKKMGGRQKIDLILTDIRILL